MNLAAQTAPLLAIKGQRRFSFRQKMKRKLLHDTNNNQHDQRRPVF